MLWISVCKFQVILEFKLSVLFWNHKKGEVREIIRLFDQLEEIELGAVSIFTICSALKEFISSLPGNILDCIKDKLEESILEPEKFIEKTKKLLGKGQNSPKNSAK